MTATDRGHIEEIITHLQKVEQDYKINLSSEKEWLMGLENNSVWHDANMLPDNPDEIVIEHGEYGISIVPACKMSRPKGSKWAYIKDILKL